MAVDLPGSHRPLNTRQKLLRFGQGQPQICDITKTFWPADLYQIGTQTAGIIAGRNQPQHPSHQCSPSRLSTRPIVPRVASSPHSLDTPTIHDPTNTNVVIDAPHKDLRRARSAMLSLSPTTTGSATAIALIYPELKGKLNGHAVRAPVLNASLTDCVFEMARPITEIEVNGLFCSAARGPLAGILGFEDRPLVSADYANDPRSAIVDGPSTMVTDETLLKVYAWYDNEVGYACRMVDLATIVIERSR
jgi:hypothetical protein